MDLLVTQFSVCSANGSEKLPETSQSSSMPLAISCIFLYYLASVFIWYIWFNYTAWFLHAVFTVEQVKDEQCPRALSTCQHLSWWKHSRLQCIIQNSVHQNFLFSVLLFTHSPTKNKSTLGTSVTKPHLWCSSVFPALPSLTPHPLQTPRQEELCSIPEMFLDLGQIRSQSLGPHLRSTLLYSLIPELPSSLGTVRLGAWLLGHIYLTRIYIKEYKEGNKGYSLRVIHFSQYCLAFLILKARNLLKQNYSFTENVHVIKCFLLIKHIFYCLDIWKKRIINEIQRRIWSVHLIETMIFPIIWLRFFLPRTWDALERAKYLTCTLVQYWRCVQRL